MKNPTRQTDRHVGAVLAALDVLESFFAKSGLTATEIMKATGLTRNRVMRLTGTLIHRGFLMVDSETGAFSIGAKIYGLGKVFEHNCLILSLVKPILKDIALKTEESVSLYGREGYERVVLAREEGIHAIRHALSEGQRMDLHAGAGGKVILAYLPPEMVETILAKIGLPKRTERTITDKRKFLKELENIRSQGYAVSIGERAADVCAIAIPFFEYGQELAGGSICISGPVSRFTPQIRRSYAEVLLAAGRKLSRELGWTPAKNETNKPLSGNDAPKRPHSNDCRK